MHYSANVQSMLLPFFVLFPLVKAVTTSANDKRSSVNSTVSFHRSSAVVVNADSSQTANVVYGGHNLQTDEGEKRSANAVKRKHFKGLALFSNSSGIWPGAVVPYELVPYLNVTQRGVVRYAMNAFQKHTCIKFRKRTERDMYYLLISGIPRKCTVGRDTSSHRTNEGKFITDLNMDPQCFNRPAMIHELMHSIGFHHEHQREDRDPRVTEGPRDPDPSRDFYTRYAYSRAEAQYMGEYDVESVMHYPFNNFKPYIRKYFTRSDINNINTLYKCSINTNSIMAKRKNRKNIINKDNIRMNPWGALRQNVQNTSNGWGINAIHLIDQLLALIMGTANGKSRNAAGKTWVTFKRNSKNAARTNPAARSFNNYRRYFERKNVRRTNTPARIYKKDARTTRGRPAIWMNNAARTIFKRNPGKVAKRNPAVWSSNNLYSKPFVGNKAVRKNTSSRENHTTSWNTLRANAMGSKSAARSITNRYPRITVRKNSGWGSKSTRRRFFAGRNDVRKDTYPRVNHMTSWNTPRVNTMWSKNAARSDIKRYPRTAAGKNPTRWGFKSPKKRYFAGNNAVRKNTYPRENHKTGWNTPKVTMWSKNAAPSGIKRYPRTAAGKNSARWSFKSPKKRYFAEYKVRGKNTSSGRNNYEGNTERPMKKNTAAKGNTSIGRFIVTRKL